MRREEKVKLPSAPAIASLLTDLLGGRAKVEPGTKLGPNENGFIGELLGPTGALLGLTFSDRAFAASSGAALAMIPRGVAEDAVRKGVVPPNLLENHYEVVNVLTSALNALHPSAQHVKLAKIHPTGPTLPAPIRALWLKPPTRVDFVVELTGYGTSRLTLVG